MIDASLSGVRCRAAQDLFNRGTAIGAQTEGTIVCEVESSKGNLLSVCWDNGLSSLVEGDSIELTDSEIVWQ